MTTGPRGGANGHTGSRSATRPRRGRDGLPRAGFVVPHAMQSWRSFVENGDLGRTLVRMCILGGRAVPLSFVLERSPSGITVDFVLRGTPVQLDCGAELLEEMAINGLALLLRELNSALGKRGIDWRFVVDEKHHRLTLLDASAAARAAARSWLVDKCLDPALAAERTARIRARTKRKVLPRLPIPEQIVPPKRHFVEDPSYPGLLADYFLRLAAFARVGPVTCEPMRSRNPRFQNDDCFWLRVTWTFPSGGSLQETVQIRPGTRVPLQPICDAINRGLAMRRSRRKGPRVKAYLCASSPIGEHVVFATVAEAARLRRHAYLIEPEPSGLSLASLGDAGFELPYLGGSWEGWRQLDCVLTRTCVLIRARIVLSAATARPDGEGVVIRYRAGDATAECRYPPVTGNEEVVDVLPRLYRDLNAFVGAQGVAHRFVMMKAEPHWYTPRVLLLPPSLVAAIANAPGTYLDCLPPEASHPLPAPTRHPERAFTEVLARVPTVMEIVGKRQVLNSDFKCPARSTDYPSVVEQIARFAQVRISVDPLAIADEGAFHYDVHVSHAGVRAVIRLDNEKYAQVAPILACLNPILAARQDPRRLYRFTAGGFDGGVVMATPEEAARLREMAYLVDQ